MTMRRAQVLPWPEGFYQKEDDMGGGGRGGVSGGMVGAPSRTPRIPCYGMRPTREAAEVR